MNIEPLFGGFRGWRAWLPALLTLTLLTIGNVLLGGDSEGAVVRQQMSAMRLIGTSIMFILVPTVALAGMVMQWRRSTEAIRQLKPLMHHSVSQNLELRLSTLPWSTAWLILLGGIWGHVQNRTVYLDAIASDPVVAFDLFHLAGNCIVWMSVAFALAWRFPFSLALSRAGRSMHLNLYQLQQVQPLVRVASTDVLLVVALMALMPLQALGAEVYLGNYLPGFVVGAVAAGVLVLVPLHGVQQNIAQLKQTRLTELNTELSRLIADRADTARIELQSAHIHRIASQSTWPVDLGLATRILGYVVIPPLAWVAAALVERAIDNL